MDKKFLKEEELNLVSGGVLVEGWDTALKMMMEAFKNEYGESGKQMLKDMMIASVNDPTSPVESADLQTLNQFIDDNWALIKAR